KARAGCSRWVVSPREDVFEGWHDGYIALEDPVMHRRRIVMRKPERRVLIDDTLQMEGEHEVEIFLHCHEDCEVATFGRTTRIAREDRALEIEWPDAPGGRVEILRGSVDPIGGWVSRSYDRKIPTHTLVWNARLAGRSVLRTAIEVVPTG